MRSAIGRTGATAPLRRGGALKWVALVITCMSVTACSHPAQIWPTPLTPGAQVTAKFTSPRAIPLGHDSVLVAEVLSGEIVALHGDTLVMRLTMVPEQTTRAAWLGREASVPLDSATRIMHSEFNQSSSALLVAAGFAFVFAFIGSLPQ